MSEENAAVEAEVTPEVEPEVSEEIQEAIEESAEGAEESEEVEEEIDSPSAAEEQQEELKEMIKSLKYKVNGKELEEELPFEIDPEHMEYLQKKFQMAGAGQEAMRNSAEVEKAYEARMNSLKDNPWATLEELGLDPDELAELRIQQRIEEMQKSPDQLKQEAMEQELQTLREKLQKEELSKQQAQQDKILRETEVEMGNQIKEAISSHTQLPNEPFVVKKMADAMLWALDNGYEDVKASDIAPIVEKEITNEYQRMVDLMPDKVLESFMGKKAMDRLRKQRISKSKAPAAANKIPETGNKAEVKKEVKKRTLNDFLNSPLVK